MPRPARGLRVDCSLVAAGIAKTHGRVDPCCGLCAGFPQMTASTSNDLHATVLVLITSDNDDASLAAQAAKLEWAVRRVAQPADALRNVLQQRPGAAVVHISRSDDAHA